jgi:DNA-binding MarR family transcriptional regulator
MSHPYRVWIYIVLRYKYRRVPSPPMRDADYRALADVRFRLRQFMAFSEEQARAVGLEPVQHQLLLALRGLPSGARPTIGTLAERLVVRHHSVVELVDRLERAGMIRRDRDPDDRRTVLVSITRRGHAKLDRLSIDHRAELARTGPQLVTALRRVLRTA